jgi:hypothetical protein
MKRYTSVFVISLFLLLNFIGCSNSDNNPVSTQSSKTSLKKLSSRQLINPSEGVYTGNVITFSWQDMSSYGTPNWLYNYEVYVNNQLVASTTPLYYHYATGSGVPPTSYDISHWVFSETNATVQCSPGANTWYVKAIFKHAVDNNAIPLTYDATTSYTTSTGTFTVLSAPSVTGSIVVLPGEYQGYGSPVISWNAVTGASGYTIRKIDPDNGTTEYFTTNTSTLSYTDASVQHVNLTVSNQGGVGIVTYFVAATDVNGSAGLYSEVVIFYKNNFGMRAGAQKF